MKVVILLMHLHAGVPVLHSNEEVEKYGKSCRCDHAACAW